MKIYKKKKCPTTYYRHKKELSKRLSKFGRRIPDNSVGIRRDYMLDSETETETEHVEMGENIEINEPCPSNFDETEVDFYGQSSTNINCSLSNDIQQWALRFKVNHKAVTDLLKILSEKLKQNVPEDARTLLKTPRSIPFDEIHGGTMWYHGIKNCLNHSIFANCTQSMTVGVNFNIDGLPLYRSAKNEFWPILMNFARMPEIKPMVVAIYLGTKKPSSVKQFLSKFVNEFNDVCANGVEMLTGKTVKIKVNAFICDKPARAHIKCRLNLIHQCCA